MKYTHSDSTGMKWRMVGSRPVSALADRVMRECGLPPLGSKPQKNKPKRK